MVKVSCVPALRDNYIWLLHAPADPARVLVVDPGDDAPVRARLERDGLTLAAILVTHHHWDHTDGIAALVAAHGCPVYGPAHEAIPCRTHALADGDHVTVEGLEFDILEVPGHTAAPIAWAGDGFVLVGDTLFAAGCGRLFEGSPEQMQRSLGRLRALPDGTLVYCAHEYTLANLAFARAVEPDNAAIEHRIVLAEQRRANGEPTIPSELAEERETNPFLRWDEPTVVEAASRYARTELTTAVDVFATVRRWKDGF